MSKTKQRTADRAESVCFGEPRARHVRVAEGISAVVMHKEAEIRTEFAETYAFRPVRTNQKGFTLIEMLVTIAVFGLVMVVTANLLLTIFTNSTTSPNALNAVDQAESASSNFVNQIRDASYGNDGSYPLGEASTTEIIFFSPYGSSGSTTVDRIRYFVASSTLYEGVTVPSGSPLSYNLANEQVTTVVKNVAGVGTSTVFYYYTGTYAGTSSPLSQPVNINQVTYVGLTMSVRLQEVIGATTTSVISTGAAIRNLKTNLGN